MVSSSAGPVGRAIAGGGGSVHAGRVSAWIPDVHPQKSEFCNSAALISAWTEIESDLTSRLIYWLCESAVVNDSFLADEGQFRQQVS